MKFRLIRASNYLGQKTPPAEGAVADGTDGDWTIEIGTLEELLSLQKTVMSDLIVNSDSIWIYDTYME